MKTLTLQVKTAVEITPGVYDSTQEICTFDGNNGLFVQTLDLPASMTNIQPKTMASSHISLQEHLQLVQHGQAHN